MRNIKARKEGSKLVFVDEYGKSAVYDLKDNRCYHVANNGSLREVQNLNKFFVHSEPRNIHEWFEDDKYARFIKKIAQREDRCTNIGTLLDRLGKYAYLEQYVVLGIDVDSYGVRSKINDYSSDVIKFLVDSKRKLTSTFENLYLRNKDLVNNLCRLYLYNYTENEPCRKIITVLFEYYFDTYKDLITTYNYDYKRTIEYLAYLNDYEGLAFPNSLTELRDYARMQRTLSLGNKYERYPRYLRTIHDIASRNFQIFKKSYSEEAFKQRCNPEMEYTGREYSVVLPKNIDDLKAEGANLHHCVGSYVDSVIEGKTQILFLRKDVEESLVTIEVRNGRLSQARGLYNRSISEKEEEFLKRYCAIKNIEFGV